MEPKYTFNIGMTLGAKPVRAMSVLVFASDTPIDREAVQFMLLEQVKAHTYGLNIDIGATIASVSKEAKERFGYLMVHVPTDVTLQMGVMRLNDDPDAPTRQEVV